MDWFECCNIIHNNQMKNILGIQRTAASDINSDDTKPYDVFLNQYQLNRWMFNVISEWMYRIRMYVLRPINLEMLVEHPSESAEVRLSIYAQIRVDGWDWNDRIVREIWVGMGGR
eukprot:944839_1